MTLMELWVKKKAQDPLVARSASRPTFASLMGYKRSLVDTCKSSNVLIVSTLVVFMFSRCVIGYVFCINKLCNEELSLLHIMTRNCS